MLILVEVMKDGTLMTNKYLVWIIVLIAVFCAGYAYCYQKYVPDYKNKVSLLEGIIDDYKSRETLITAVSQSSKSEVAYVPKVSGEKTDVEFNDISNQITVRYNGEESVLQSVVDEKQKFEQGKLVIDRSQQTVIDLTEAFNKAVAAESKAKNNTRIGKVDFGVLYNTDSEDAYAGIRYNAKMFDIGAYHGVGNSDVIISIHGNF